MFSSSDRAWIFGILLLILSQTTPNREAHPYLVMGVNLVAGYYLIKALFLGFKDD